MVHEPHKRADSFTLGIPVNRQATQVRAPFALFHYGLPNTAGSTQHTALAPNRE